MTDDSVPDDSGLFPGDFSDGRTQIFFMIHRNGSDGDNLCLGRGG